MSEESLSKIINKKMIVAFTIITVLFSLLVFFTINGFINYRVYNIIYNNIVDSAFNSLEQYYESTGKMENSSKQALFDNITSQIKELEERNTYLEKIDLYNEDLQPADELFSRLSDEERFYFKSITENGQFIKRNRLKSLWTYYTRWSYVEEGNTSSEEYYLKVHFDFSQLSRLGWFLSLAICLLLLAALLVFVLFNINLSREITGPFVQLAKSMNQVSTIDLIEFDKKLDKTDIKEVNMLLSSYQGMTGELSSTFQELKAMNEQLHEAYQESNMLADKLNNVIGVAGKLTDTIFDDKEIFLKELFRVAKSMVSEADFGSVYLVEGESWRYIDTVGHDLEKLQQLSLKREYLPRTDNVSLIENFLAFEKNEMPSHLLKKVAEASKPIKSTLTVKLWIGNELSGGMSLDIARDSEKTFSRESYETVKAFANLASAFLTMQSYSNIQENFQREIIFSMINILELHDRYTRGHSENVARISVLFAERMGLEPQEVKAIYWAGLVHDIGKILVDNQILNKPGSLNDDEYGLIKKHPILGYEVLRGSEELRDIAIYVRHHHERWDGTGYPDQLKGVEIPLLSQIIAVADAWDTMRSERVYRTELSRETAVRELKEGRGTQFAPQVVDQALELIEEGEFN